MKLPYFNIVTLFYNNYNIPSLCQSIRTPP